MGEILRRHEWVWCHWSQWDHAQTDQQEHGSTATNSSVQKISLLSTRNYKCSAPVTRIRWTLHRIGSETQESNNTRLVSPLQYNWTRAAHKHRHLCQLQCHITSLVRSRLPDLVSALLIQPIKIMLLGYFLSDNSLVLVIVSKLYLSGKLQFPVLDCLFFPWYYLLSREDLVQQPLEALGKRSSSWGCSALLPRLGFHKSVISAMGWVH